MMAVAPPSRPLLVAARVAALVATAAGLLLAVTLADLSGLLFFVAYAGIGAYLAVRRPTNPIGWLLMVTGLGLAIGSVRVTTPFEALLAGGLDPRIAASAWANGCGWSLAFIGFFGVTVVFPRGELPSGRVRWPSQIALVLMCGLAGLLAVGPTINVTAALTGVSADIPNPFALAPGAAWWTILPPPDVLYSTMFGIFALGLVGLILRYRRSVGLERLQYRWLVTAIAFVALANLVWAIATVVLRFEESGLTWLPVLVAYPTVPIAIGVAVLRHRLYEIDRIISRTIAYVGVSAILAAVFGAGILILSSALASFAPGQGVAVAASTLAAYAVFQPVLRRVRRDVDRRFNRARYDAERTVIAFADRLQSETDMEAVKADLTTTAGSAVAPASMSLWLRPRSASR